MDGCSQFEAYGESTQMATPRPFSIRIFCPDGNPIRIAQDIKIQLDGLRLGVSKIHFCPW